MSEYPDVNKVKDTISKHRDGTTTITERRVSFKNGYSAWDGWKVACRYKLLDKDGKVILDTKNKFMIDFTRRQLLKSE